MKQEPTIQYNTAKLKAQWDKIAKSQMHAIRVLTLRSSVRTRGLSENDPPELWKYVVSRSAQPRLGERATALAKRFRQLDPQFVGNPENVRLFRERLGKPTFRETVQALSDRIEDDAELVRHLSKLLKLYKRVPAPKGRNDKDWPADEDRAAHYITRNWIRGRVEEPLLCDSLCFFSDLAIAKLVYFQDHQKWLPRDASHLTKTEPERIAKLYRSLGLIPARPRIIKDVDRQDGLINLIPMKSATRKGAA